MVRSSGLRAAAAFLTCEAEATSDPVDSVFVWSAFATRFRLLSEMVTIVSPPIAALPGWALVAVVRGDDAGHAVEG
jgi:hypothetical protein